MAGVGDQRHRVAGIAKQRLHHDERGVQGDADRERRAKACRRVMVSAGSVIVAVAVTMIVRVSMIVAMIMMAVRCMSHRGVTLRSSDAADMGESASEYYYILATLLRVETKAAPPRRAQTTRRGIMKMLRASRAVLQPGR